MYILIHFSSLCPCLSNLGFSIITGLTAKTALGHIFVLQNVLSEITEKKK